MRHFKGWIFLAGVLFFVSGCATNAMVGNYQTRSGKYFHGVGIKGDHNTYTLEAGSLLEKISIWGNENTVWVQEDVPLVKVEFFGNDNVVYMPPYLYVQQTAVGQRNRIEPNPNISPMGYASSPMNAERMNNVRPAPRPGEGEPAPTEMDDRPPPPPTRGGGEPVVEPRGESGMNPASGDGEIST
jgi:hypothetical protein